MPAASTSELIVAETFDLVVKFAVSTMNFLLVWIDRVDVDLDGAVGPDIERLDADVVGAGPHRGCRRSR